MAAANCLIIYFYLISSLHPTWNHEYSINRKNGEINLNGHADTANTQQVKLYGQHADTDNTQPVKLSLDKLNEYENEAFVKYWEAELNK